MSGGKIVQSPWGEIRVEKSVRVPKKGASRAIWSKWVRQTVLDLKILSHRANFETYMTCSLEYAVMNEIKK